MTRDDVTRMAREAGYGWSMTDMHAPALERFAELIAAAEADKHDTGTHTCSNRCQRYACVALREAVAAEREACKAIAEKELGNTAMLTSLPPQSAAAWNILAAIRARGEV